MRDSVLLLTTVGVAAIVGPTVAAFAPGAPVAAGLLPAALPLAAVLVVRAARLAQRGPRRASSAARGLVPH